jgi:hypothetical protein
MLSISVTSLLDRVKLYERATPQARRPPSVAPLAKWLEHGLVQLGSVHTTFRQTEFIVRDMQRVWLELWAVLDYMEIYKPCMDGRAPAAVEVADTIGVFTHSIRVAQDFFVAGLPCWLIRPFSELTDQNILEVVDLIPPEGYLTLGRHRFPYPIIFTGSASSLEKYHNIHQYARNFLHSPDPFGSASVPSAFYSSANQPVAGTSTQLQPGHSRAPSQRYPKKTRATGGHKPGKLMLSIYIPLRIIDYHCSLPTKAKS